MNVTDEGLAPLYVKVPVIVALAPGFSVIGNEAPVAKVPTLAVMLPAPWIVSGTFPLLVTVRVTLDWLFASTFIGFVAAMDMDALSTHAGGDTRVDIEAVSGVGTPHTVAFP
ncbi:Uncharacterised protein [uncultured archaeon]|nr:Uncharacterised protein [uncultured archaeon]